MKNVIAKYFAAIKDHDPFSKNLTIIIISIFGVLLLYSTTPTIIRCLAAVVILALCIFLSTADNCVIIPKRHDSEFKQLFTRFYFLFKNKKK